MKEQKKYENANNICNQVINLQCATSRTSSFYSYNTLISHLVPKKRRKKNKKEKNKKVGNASPSCFFVYNKKKTEKRKKQSIRKKKT